MRGALLAAAVALVACGGMGGGGSENPAQIPLCPQPLASCGGACIDLGFDPRNCGACGRACEAGQRCAFGGCLSGCGGLFDCGGRCVDLFSDPANCGVCGLRCPAGFACAWGLCAPRCPDGTVDCGEGRCAHLPSSPIHCGACGRSCGPGQPCIAGQCVGGGGGERPPPPMQGSSLCHGGLTDCNGSCVDLLVDEQHCGHCGRVCTGTAACVSGTCL